MVSGHPPSITCLTLMPTPDSWELCVLWARTLWSRGAYVHVRSVVSRHCQFSRVLAVAQYRRVRQHLSIMKQFTATCLLLLHVTMATRVTRDLGSNTPSDMVSGRIYISTGYWSHCCFKLSNPISFECGANWELLLLRTLRLGVSLGMNWMFYWNFPSQLLESDDVKFKF